MSTQITLVAGHRYGFSAVTFDKATHTLYGLDPKRGWRMGAGPRNLRKALLRE